MPDDRPVSPEERIARAFHEEYERLAPDFGYETRRESAVPWEEVPQQNATLMMSVVHNLLARGVIALSTPAGPSPERWELVQTDDGPFIQERSPAPSPREEAVAKAANDMRWAARKLRDGGEPPIVADMLDSYAVALSAARPSSPTPEEVEALREAAHAAHEFAGNVIRYATGPVKPELWEDDSPLVEQAWSIVRATDSGASTTKEGR